ncbi:protein of unknown function [Methylocaldum szegediense]|uniref:Uncharacterized protein n=1 Tax=Methylocaldum szegediense TaxID=73780 RepID=A0ABN8X4G4_9GAMM|nr:protein of unknown function [Methylocaldum szegediense]
MLFAQGQVHQKGDQARKPYSHPKPCETQRNKNSKSVVTEFLNATEQKINYGTHAAITNPEIRGFSAIFAVIRTSNGVFSPIFTNTNKLGDSLLRGFIA